MPASRALRFVDRPAIDALLARYTAEPGDRAFILRCILDEGPIHHRGANFVLIALLSQLLARLGNDSSELADPTSVPMRLPPHLADEIGESNYPLPLSTRALQALAGGDPAQLEAMIDCLTDGPAQHVLANVLMVNLLDRLLAAEPT